MTLLRLYAFVLIAALFLGCATARKPGAPSGPGSFHGKVLTGLDVLLRDKPAELLGKRLGLITNPTGVTSSLEQNVDALIRNGFQVVALFGPEHGVRGDVEGGKGITSYTDERTGLPVYSLYGKTRKPTPEMLRGVDVLVFDIQDIGIRPYTYISTMALAMEAAAENGLPFVVLDRPNPLGGQLVEGPVLDERFKSFIGIYPIPYVYGLTVGELAAFFNREFGISCDLRVIRMRGWQRSMLWPDTELPWVPTSPHIPHWFTALYCAATGAIGELGTVCEGVGTPAPFELIGAPWIDAYKLADELNRRRLPGVFFRPVTFRPFYFRFAEQSLSGVQIHILDPRKFRPVWTQLHILHALIRLHPEAGIFDSERVASFDRAWGTDQVRQMLLEGKTPEEIVQEWQEQLADYLVRRQSYLLY